MNSEAENHDEDLVHYIECPCGMREEFPLHHPRHKSQTFTHVENLENGEAEYECPCGKKVQSICTN